MPMYRPRPHDKEHSESRCRESLPYRENYGTLYLCSCGRAFKCVHATNSSWRRIRPEKYNKILVKQQKRKEKYDLRMGRV